MTINLPTSLNITLYNGNVNKLLKS